VIRLARKRTSIPKAFKQPKLNESADSLLAIYFAAPGGPYGFKSSAWKPAKNALKKESAGKCAYCEAPTDVVAHGDVEHFRPKSIYWWLALCFDNYLYSCQICNQTYKGDKFPIAGAVLANPPMPNPPAPAGGSPPHQALVQALVLDASAVTDAQVAALWATEDADLPHPCFEDPEALFTWEVDDVNEEVWIRSKGGARADRAYAAVTECLGLNRDELRRERFVNFATIATFRAILDAQPSPQIRALAEAEVTRMQAAKEPFAGMRRHFAREWGLPGPG